jgi:hypothetical protein
MHKTQSANRLKAFINYSATASLALVVMPISATAQEKLYKAEGVKAIAAGSINPPDPVEGCKQAKQNAQEKASNAGFGGKVEWDHLSSDSDCRLKTQGGTTTGYIYIFTASGKFYAK